MKNSITIFAAVTCTVGGMWFSLHSTTVTDACCWGYIAGMYGALAVRITVETDR